MATGNGGQLAIAHAGSLYSASNTVNIWANFVSETLEHKLNEVKEGAITGRRDEPNSYKGIDHGDGDIVIEPNPNFIGHLAKAWFGTLASSTVCGATSTGANSVFGGAQVNFHRFTPNQSAYELRTYLDPFNVMIYKDVGSAWQHFGAIFPSLKFDIKAGALVKCTAKLMSRNVQLIQRTATIQSLVSSGGRPWIWDQASIELSTDTTTANLSAHNEFEEVAITYDMPQEGVVLMDGTKQYAEFVPSNFRSIKIEGTMSFRDQTDYLTFKAYEAVRMRLTLLNVNSALMLGNPNSLDATNFLGYFGMRFHFPQMKFLSFSNPITGPKRIIAKFTAKAEWNQAEGISSALELNCIASSADYTTTY